MQYDKYCIMMQTGMKYGCREKSDFHRADGCGEEPELAEG
jgi:hypothetical protein